MVDSVNSSHAARPRLMPVSTEASPGGASGAKAHKEAVANGNYPVDAKRIADSIFQDYSAMTR